MSIIEILRQVTDKRGYQGRQYSSVSIILLLLLSRLCGYQGVKSAWRLGKLLSPFQLSKLGLSKMPTYQCMLFILQKLDALSLEKALSRSIMLLSNPIAARVYAIDGKRLRCSSMLSTTTVHLVSLFRYHDWAVCGQVSCTAGGGELAAAKYLAGNVDITGKVMTGDALFTNADLCDVICGKRGDYVFIVKENQPTLSKEIEQAFEEVNEDKVRSYSQQIEKHHGRVEQRSIEVIDMPWEYQNGWNTIKQIGRITREREHVKTGKKSKETVWMITSLTKKKASPAVLLACNRGHWSIENRLHRTRDTLFNEDKNNLRKAQTPQINAEISNFAIFLARRINKSITEATQLCATNINMPLQLIRNFF